MNLKQYLALVSSAISTKNGAELAKLASLNKNPVDVNLQNESDHNLEFACRAILHESYAEVFSLLLKCRKYFVVQNYQQANQNNITAVIKFLEIFRRETNWIVPFLHVLTYDTRKIAIKSDKATSEASGNEVHDDLRKAEQHLKKGFAMALNDRAPADQSKKWGSLFIINQLFKIYFKLNTIRLCQNLIRAVEGPAFPDFNGFNLRDKVTYQFYIGRISMFEDLYHKAEKCLDFAWNHCHTDYHKNKRMILQYLIPVKLFLGIMPSVELLVEYNLPEFKDLTEAVKSGNVYQFNQCLEDYQDDFIAQGIYLLVERLKLVVLRNLFKKIYLIRQSHQIQLGDFQIALNCLSNSETDLDEVECMVANLIFKGFVKGYMSHQKKVLVVSKACPFPAITDVAS